MTTRLAAAPSRPTYAQQQNLSYQLNRFCNDVPHISYALAVAGDGIPLAASDQVPSEVRDQLAAAASGLYALGAGIGTLMGTDVDKLIVEFPEGWMVLQSTGGTDDRLFLLALAGIAADLGQVHFELIRLGESIGQVLDPGARTPA
jgi:predicted regulator of Ras-like GTPase activity (Roadblock/LC7/MglB family)